jgi:hypothetical protein
VGVQVHARHEAAEGFKLVVEVDVEVYVEFDVEVAVEVNVDVVAAACGDGKKVRNGNCQRDAGWRGCPTITVAAAINDTRPSLQ